MSETLQPPGWAPPRGYANGIAARGRQIFVAGQIGWDENGNFHSADFVQQTGQALQNILAVLREANAGPEHIVRLTWYVVDKREYLDGGKALGEAYRAVMGRHYPAMSAVEVAGLMEDAARVEIEATAVVPDGDDGRGGAWTAAGG